MGGKSAGMGFASATISDEWAFWNNPAGLSNVKGLNIGASREYQAISGFDRLAALVTAPARSCTFGAGAFRFGDDIYNEQLVSVAFSNQLGLASLGVRLDYIQYSAADNNTYHALGITAGGIASLTSQLSIGFYGINVNQPKLENGELLPVKLAAGLQVKPSEKITAVVEIEKDIREDPTLKGGFECVVLRKASVRTGIHLFPNAAFIGMGLRAWQTRIDYALQYSYLTGYSQQASVSLSILKKKRK